jgi:peptide/nickel transport system substrate-binding protein
MTDSYWAKILHNRISRRRTLLQASGAAAGAALLAACGGGDSDDARDKNSLLTEPVDTTKQAKRGGIIKDRLPLGDPPTLDILTANNPHNAVGPHVYSALLQTKPGHLKAPEDEIIGDLAESWEWSSDGLQIVMKLRQGMRWHPKPPVNGRPFDVDDALFAWDRFTRLSAARQAVANVAHPDAPVLSLTATDSRTLVLKLKEPLVYASALFANNFAGRVVMIPKETDTAFDIRGDMIGTGPYVMSNYTPSVGFTLKRNPDYYDKDYALADQVDLPIIVEYAQALAQFKAGNIYTMGSRGASYGVTAEDIFPIKREEPRLLIYPGDLAGAGGNKMIVSYLPGSPFLDERVRQAISMSFDRDLYIDTLNNVSGFEAEGVPVETRWNTALAATSEGWWLNPKDKDFGPNAKFFNYDVGEAKKLLAAAGYPSGIKDVASNYVTGPQLPTSKQAEIMNGMLAEIGITTKANSIDYGTEYIPQYRDGKGQHEGLAFKSTAGAATNDPVNALAHEYWSKGSALFYGFSTSGKNDLSGDPQVNILIEKAQRELDTERRRSIVFDIQRYLAKPWYAYPGMGVATGFEMVWPCLANFRVWRRMAPFIYGQWIDDTKPPFKPS